MAKIEKQIYLIDGSGYMFRAFYAMFRQRLSNSHGLPTGGILVFARMLLKVIRDKSPDYIAVAFDTPEPTFRHELYPAYKANRDAPPEDLVAQIPYMQRAVEVLRIPVLVQPGAEADDLIGSVAAQAVAEGFCAVLVTADKDFMQLVSEKVMVWDPMKDVTFGPAEVEKRWGVPPDKVIDVQALMGDSSDNVPGVPGIGEKTAIALIQEFGGLEVVLNSVEHIKRAKQRQNIEDNSDLARLSKELCTIRRNWPLEKNLESCRLGDADFEAASKLFVEELEFNNILEQLPGYAGSRLDTESKENGSPASRKTEKGFDYRIVRTKKELAAFSKELNKAKRVSLDLETTSLNPMRAEIVGFNFSMKAGRAFYIPIGHEGLEVGPQLPLKEILGVIKKPLTSPKAEKVGQNLKYDLAILAGAGLTVNGPVFDTMVSSYLIHSDRTSHGLDHLSEVYLGEKTIKYADLCGTGAKQIPFSHVPIDAAARYGCQDADFTIKIADRMKSELKEMDLKVLFYDLEMPLLRVILEMELTGIRLDSVFLKKMGKKLSKLLEKMKEKIYELAGQEFNVNSTPQLREILFSKLDLPVIRRTKTGPSTDIDTLERLSLQHPLPQEILNYRQLAKLKNTYVDTLPGLVNQKTGRIHAKFNQTVAATGRLSGADPNLQNIPIRTELGREIRRAFLPEEGWKLLSVDYSQIELRVLAHFTEDSGLISAFERGEDIHATTAAAVYGASPADVTGEMRRVAKAVNFGIVYGQRAFGLSQTLGISRGEAQSFIDTYFERFSKVPVFIDNAIAEGEKCGYVVTLLNRRRYVPDLMSRNKNFRNAAERTAINSIMQGSAADIIKKAMINISGRLKKEKRNSRMLVQVHDELLFEVPPKELKPVTKLVSEEMEGAVSIRVPLAVDSSVGDNWGDVH